ncbi:MAG: hypothetical protein S4CHLAM20_11000 [Chlamydiia bacterium]|nr:hypothetical protein [Chlamydiia bacterium]
MKYLLVFLTSVSLWAQDNKIVYIVASPRSLSSAMFRMFENRDDFVGFHESTMPIHSRRKRGAETAGWYQKSAFKTYNDLTAKIVKESRINHVVLKDVIFTTEQFVLQNNELLKNSQIHFVFLVRHPYWILQSLYKGDGMFHPIYNQLVGVKQLYETYQKAKDLNPNKVHLVFSEELSKYPRETLEIIFANIDIPFSEKSLSWNQLPEPFDGEKWYASKRYDLFRFWHHDALMSTCIRPLKRLDVPSEEDMYRDLFKDEDREKLFEVYRYHLPFYKKFLEEKK